MGTYGSHYIGNLYALNPDGTLKWMFTIPHPGIGDSSPAIGSDGTIYIGTDLVHKNRPTASSLCAISPDGRLKWKFDTEGYGELSPAIGADGTVYIGSGDGNLYALGAPARLRH